MFFDFSAFSNNTQSKFKYTDIYHNCLGFFYLFSLKKGKKGLNYDTLRKKKAFFMLCSSVAVLIFDLYLNVFVVVNDMGPSLSSVMKFSFTRQLWKESLCIKLLGRSFLIHCSRGFPLTKIIAAFVLLPHAVHQEEDEEDGEEKSNNSTCNDGCEARNK